MRLYDYYTAGALPPAAGDTFSDAVLALSPTGYWRMGDASGGAADSSGNGYDLTQGGTPTYGAAGWTTDGDDAITFDGSTDYFTRANASWMHPGTNDFSVMWASKMSSWPAANAQIIGRDGNGYSGDWLVRLSSSANVVQIYLDSTSYNLFPTAGLLQDGSFHLCAIAFDRSANATLYIDSETPKTVSISSTSASDLTNSQNLFVGSRDSGHFFPGTLDEVAFWNNHLLTSGEFSTLLAAR